MGKTNNLIFYSLNQQETSDQEKPNDQEEFYAQNDHRYLCFWYSSAMVSLSKTAACRAMQCAFWRFWPRFMVQDHVDML